VLVVITSAPEPYSSLASALDPPAGAISGADTSSADGGSAAFDVNAAKVVTVTFYFTPEHLGIAPHHTSPPQAHEEFVEFCGAMVRRYLPAARRRRASAGNRSGSLRV
jgi:hypothetical protein